MKRLIPMIGLLVTGAALASPFPWSPITPHRDATSPRPARGCADFSGQWKGDCGDIKDVSAKLVQSGCSYLTSGGESYHIGGFKTVTELVPASADISPGYVDQLTTTVAWSDDRKELRAHGSSLMQQLPEALGTPVSLDATLHLEGDELVEKVSWGTKSVECRFHKQ